MYILEDKIKHQIVEDNRKRKTVKKLLNQIVVGEYYGCFPAREWDNMNKIQLLDSTQLIRIKLSQENPDVN